MPVVEEDPFLIAEAQELVVLVEGETLDFQVLRDRLTPVEAVVEVVETELLVLPEDRELLF